MISQPEYLKAARKGYPNLESNPTNQEHGNSSSDNTTSPRDVFLIRQNQLVDLSSEIQDFYISNIRLQIRSITEGNISSFKQLNLQLFPVEYQKSFYSDILTKHSKSLCKLGILL